jgi:uncharacterized metal-binding protein YceD (DUF177 family)
MCQIFIDRLTEGREELIDWSLPSTFLDIHEESLSFAPEVSVQGKAYLADNFLIIQVNIEATALLPCVICNKIVEKTIALEGFYHAEPITKERIFDFTEKLRDAILLEVPQFYECNNGNCSERQELEKFMKRESTRLPFADL